MFKTVSMDLCLVFSICAMDLALDIRILLTGLVLPVLLI